jgi:hypothetical protein
MEQQPAQPFGEDFVLLGEFWGFGDGSSTRPFDGYTLATLTIPIPNLPLNLQSPTHKSLKAKNSSGAPPIKSSKGPKPTLKPLNLQG